jgi:hypothetical protein
VEDLRVTITVPGGPVTRALCAGFVAKGAQLHAKKASERNNMAAQGVRHRSGSLRR